MGNYDFNVIGVGNSEHPANQKEAIYTEEEMLREELQTMRNEITRLSKVIKLMQSVEASPKFRIEGFESPAQEKDYISRRTDLYRTIKHAI